LGIVLKPSPRIGDCLEACVVAFLLVGHPLPAEAAVLEEDVLGQRGMVLPRATSRTVTPAISWLFLWPVHVATLRTSNGHARERYSIETSVVCHDDGNGIWSQRIFSRISMLCIACCKRQKRVPLNDTAYFGEASIITAVKNIYVGSSTPEIAF